MLVPIDPADRLTVNAELLDLGPSDTDRLEPDWDDEGVAVLRLEDDFQDLPDVWVARVAPE